ncbi:hypothetical protein [Amnibacterium kyonggiense]
MRPGPVFAMLDPAPGSTAGGDEGDIMRKAIFELWLAWTLTFGGSAALLRRS